MEGFDLFTGAWAAPSIFISIRTLPQSVEIYFVH